MIANPGPWQIQGSEAALECAPLRAAVHLDHPSHGLSGIVWNQTQLHSHAPLQLICGADRLLESYVRGNDLVAGYESCGPQSFPHVYWRARNRGTGGAVGLEIVLSMRTDLLDALPQSAVDTLVGNVSFFHASALETSAFKSLRRAKRARKITAAESTTHLFVMRDEQAGVTYAEMVHPSDFASAVVFNPESAADSWHVKSHLFPERLEKGVIRRARIGGWFLPAKNDLAVAVELAKQFIDEPLPLTT